MATKLSYANTAAALAARTARVNGGTVQIRSGADPAKPEDAPSGTLLATVQLSNPAFGAPAEQTINGVGRVAQAIANAITGDDSVDANGNAGHFRVLSAGGVCEWTGTIGAIGSGADMEVPSVALVAGQPFQVSSWALNQLTGA